MTARRWIVGIGSGIAVGVIVAAVMTFIDWRLNPGGIFHAEGHTNWAIVRETAFSWFWPVTAIVTAATLLACFLISYGN